MAEQGHRSVLLVVQGHGVRLKDGQVYILQHAHFGYEDGTLMTEPTSVQMKAFV